MANLVLLIICNFGSGIEYYTDGPTVWYDSKQYLGGVLTSTENISLSYSFDGDFIASDFSLKFDDTIFDIRNRNESDLHNAVISIYLYDGTTATEIIDSYVSGIGLDNGISYINCSTTNNSLYKYFLYTINKGEFPDSIEGSDGNVIPFMLGEHGDTSDYGLGYAYNIDMGGGKDFIYAKLPTLGDAAGTDIGDCIYVYDGTSDVTASCTYTTDTITIEGIEYKRGFITYATPTNNPLTFFGGVSMRLFDEALRRFIKLFPGLTYDDDNLTDLKNFLIKRMYVVMNKGGIFPYLEEDEIFIGFIYTDNVTGVKILKDFYNTTLIGYTIRENKIIFRWIDYDNIEDNESAIFDQTDLNINGYETDVDFVINTSQTEFQHNGKGSLLKKKAFIFYENIENRATNMVKQDVIELPCMPYIGNPLYDELWARIATKHHMILHQDAITRICATGNTDKTGILYPGEYIMLKHPNLKTPGEYRYYLIENASYNFSGIDYYTTTLNLIDIEYLKNMDTDCKLLIHSWVDGGQEFWNDACNSDSYIHDVYNIEHTTVAGSLCGCMIEGDGSTKYLKIDDTLLTDVPLHDDSKYQAAKWDILQYTDYTIFFELKFISVPTSNQVFFSNYIDVDNNISSWYLAASNAIRFWIRIGGTNKIFLNTNTNAITDTNIHQIAIIKVGNTFGLYVDGVQIDYGSTSDTSSLFGVLYFFCYGNLTQFLNSYMGEIYFGSSNIFGAAPNVGKTDTIVVKSNPFSWSGLNE